ncbi:MAG TPA: hypothetical protein VLH09_12515 [Bryobacteraceae bacterium]|nr:hypothetical protein [Bryobacteraceae bacterium]
MRHLVLLLAPMCLAAQSSPDGGLLQVRVVEASGPAHLAGSRSSVALVVEVSGDDGRPVQGATVAFRLPASGPGGTFANGLTTDVVLTGADGRASAAGVRWNKTPGTFEIRVAAAKGQLRASAASARRVLAPAADLPAASLSSGRSRRKIVLLVAGIAAGSAAAGLAVGRRASGAGGTSQTAATLSVGIPTITVGGPQ